MDGQTILLISDMRQVYLAEILTKKGYNVRCLDIRNRETALQQLEKLKRFLDKADDAYYYCFKDEGFHFIYHRFLPEDYEDFGF